MKMTMLASAALMIAGAAGLTAQTTRSARRIPIEKDRPAPAVMPNTTDTTAQSVGTTSQEWYSPTGTTCSTVDRSAAAAVKIKSDLYQSGTMISPDSAKIVALCAVPGQIGSGEMNVSGGRTAYAVDIIPNGKKTHTKVIVDAQSGAVLSSKQFGGLRGLTGWARESLEHKKNSKP
jgi:hypothetical protein